MRPVGILIDYLSGQWRTQDCRVGTLAVDVLLQGRGVTIAYYLDLLQFGFDGLRLFAQAVREWAHCRS